MFVSKTECAAELGVTLKTLNVWMQKPGFPAPVNSGRQGEEYALDLDAVRGWLAKKREREAQAKAQELTPNQRKILAQARLFEMEIEERSGRLIPTAEVEELLGDLLVELSQIFETMVPRLRSEVGLDPAACRKLTEWLDQYRLDLKAKLEEIVSRGDEAGLDDDDDDELEE